MKKQIKFTIRGLVATFVVTVGGSFLMIAGTGLFCHGVAWAFRLGWRLLP